MFVLGSPFISGVLDSEKSRNIRSLASWYLASRSSLERDILSLAGVAPADEPPRSASLPLSPASDVAFEGAEELAAILPSVEGLSPSVRRIIFMAGAVGGGVLLLAACITDKGVGLCPSERHSDHPRIIKSQGKKRKDQVGQMYVNSQSTKRSSMESN